MGAWYSVHFANRDTSPNEALPPTHDPMYGFAEERKERVMKVSNEVLSAMNIPADKRDYCAHHWVKFMQCRHDNFPFHSRCKPEHHEWEHCEYNDMVLRMKEYERERRLLERAKKKRLREAAGDPEAM